MKKMSWLALFLATPVFADTAPDPSPWNTGPLLCPAYQCVPKGGYNIEPYLYTNVIYANYNSHWKSQSETNFIQVYNSTLIQVGLLDWFNVAITPEFYYQQQGNLSSANIGDIPIQAFFQILKEQSSLPGILIGVKANFPAARYNNLNPTGSVVDAIGSGSWKPGLSFIIGKQIHIKDDKYLTVRSYFGPQFLNKFKVQGPHAYGGGIATKGVCTLGAQYTLITSFEYNFSRHGVFAFDFQWQHNNKITFKGISGFTDKTLSIIASNGGPSTDQLSIAPALEYNFNANVGFIGGIWMTIAGRNAQAFVSPTFALNIEY